MKQSTQDVLTGLLLAVFCLVLYFNSLGGIFIFDDSHSIVNNFYIKDWRYIPLFFKGYYTSEIDIPRGMFRPLLLITLSFNYLFSGLAPLGYRIINIVLHFLNGIMFYCLLRLLGSPGNLFLTGSEGACGEPKKESPFGLNLLLTLLFLAHPLNTEAVVYISSRSDLMVSFFILSGFVCYLKRQFLFTVFLYILALLTKETALVLPFLIFAFSFIYTPRPENRALQGADEFWPLGHSAQGTPGFSPGGLHYKDVKMRPDKKKELLFLFLSLAGISILYWIYRGIVFQVPKSAILNSQIRSLWSNVLTQSAVTLFYLRLFLWPNPLTVHHNFPILNSLSNPLAFFSALTISGLVIFIFVFKKRRPLVSFGLAWYLICLMPKFYALLNIVAAEHHFYLPGFGIYLILAVTAKGLYSKFKRKFIIIAIGVISVFTVLVWFRNYEYKDEVTFWKQALKSDPSSPVVHHDLGLIYIYMGLYPEAEGEFKKAQLLTPPYARRVLKNVGENLANVYRLQKRFKEALEKLNENIELNLYDFGTYQSLGVVYLDMKDEEKALAAWRKGLSFNPRAPGILLNLGLHYLRKSLFPQAKEYFQAAIKTNPDLYTAYFGLGCVFQEEGEIDSAVGAFKKSIQLNYNFADAHYRLGALYAKKSDLRALREFKEAIRLAPNFAEAYNDLAVLYASMDPAQLELARQHAQRALSLGYKVNERFLKIINLK